MATRDQQDETAETTATPAPLLPKVSLVDLAKIHAGEVADRHEQYYRSTQDMSKLYDWDGYFCGYGEEAAVKPGWYVPLAMRRPSTTYALPRVVVNRLTSMLFGVGNSPALTVEGDPDAEAYVKALAKESRLSTRMIEARGLGGSTGAVAISCGYVNGKPRIEVHNTKHMRVLKWQDRAELIPEAVVQCYAYEREEYDPNAGKYRPAKYYYLRYWDTTQDAVWEAVPERFYSRPDWLEMVGPPRMSQVPGGACPVVWIQNEPDSLNEYSQCDYQGQLGNFDQLNRLKSASTKGTIANVDPTLVVKDSREANTGVVRKGSENAIFSKGGADYLTMPGDAMKAAEGRASEIRQDVLDACQVVIPTAERLAGAAKSAAALRILFAPMTARCDVLRDQYGDMGMSRVLTCLLRQAKALGGGVQLEPRMMQETLEGGEGEEAQIVSTVQELVPGERETISLAWPPYFPATWADINQAVTATKTASGDAQLIQAETATKAIAQLFGVEDAKAERLAIDSEAAKRDAAEASKMETLLAIEKASEPDPQEEEPAHDEDEDGETEDG